MPGGWVNFGIGYSRPLVIIANLIHLPLMQFVPSVMRYYSRINQDTYDQLLPVILWVIFPCALAVAGVLLSRRRVKVEMAVEAGDILK